MRAFLVNCRHRSLSLATGASGLRSSSARPTSLLKRSGGPGVNALRASKSGLPYALIATTAALLTVSQLEPHSTCVAQSELGQADSLFDNRGKDGSLRQCLELLTKLYDHSQESDRVDLCHRLARANYNLLSSKDPNDRVTDKKALAEASLRYAQEARRVAPTDYRSFYWCGIAAQAYGDHVGGTKYTLERLNDIRADFERAHELNPHDGTTLYCLGAWCYSLSDLGWVSRKLAATLFATPPTSSFKEGLDFFLAAEKAEPRFWNKNPLMIAKSYEKMGDKINAKHWAEETVSRACETAEDEDFRKEALELVKRST